MTETIRIDLSIGDCVEVLREDPDDHYDALITDPPYGLGDDPDVDEVLESWASGEDYDFGSGFMGQEWDQVPPPSLFREILRVLKPEAQGAVFAGTRTLDLMMASLKLGGFVIDDIWRWQYGCLSEDTEILTENGWKPGIEVEEGETIATWDHEDGRVYLDEVQEVTIEPYSGTMIHLQNHDTDQLLTPNHRVYHREMKRQQTDGKREVWYDDDWEVKKAGQLKRWGGIKLPMAGYHDGPGIGGLQWAKLLGWVWTEGGFDDNGTGVRIHQSQTASPDHVSHIDALLEGVAPNHKRYSRNRVYERVDGSTKPYTEISWYFSGDPAQKVRELLPDKKPNWDLLWSMSLEEKRAFYEAAKKGDGARNKQQFYQSDKNDLKWFQTLLACIGERGKIYWREDRERGCVTWTPRKTTELQTRHLKNCETQHDGRVWCVRVPTGAFVARRKGKVFITGNSGFPKSFNVRKHILKQVEKRYEDRDVRCGCNGDAPFDPDGEPDPDCEHDRKIIPDNYHDHKLVTRVCSHCLLPDDEFLNQLEGRGTALKPSYEPVIIVHKPDPPRDDRNVLLDAYGVGEGGG